MRTEAAYAGSADVELGEAARLTVNPKGFTVPDKIMSSGASMRSGIVLLPLAVLLIDVSVTSAQDASDTATSPNASAKHSILVLKFGRSPEGQQIPSPDNFNRAPWDEGDRGLVEWTPAPRRSTMRG
ncbi:MAG: hypothetical protein U0Q18_09085 [Bryobacteraceae bacterium]